MKMGLLFGLTFDLGKYRVMPKNVLFIQFVILNTWVRLKRE